MNGFSLLRIVYMQLAVLSNSSANFYECSDVIFALGVGECVSYSRAYRENECERAIGPMHSNSDPWRASCEHLSVAELIASG